MVLTLHPGTLWIANNKEQLLTKLFLYLKSLLNRFAMHFNLSRNSDSHLLRYLVLFSQIGIRIMFVLLF